MAAAGTAGTIEMVEWSKLRARTTEPPCVIAAIPPEDIHSFLRLLAANPLEPFSDATILLKRIREIRDARIIASLETLREETAKKRKLSDVDESDDDKVQADELGSKLSKEDETDTGVLGNRKRARRSARAQTLSRRTVAGAASGLALKSGPAPKARAESVKIGLEYQADVPPSSSIKSWDALPESQQKIESPLVFSANDIGGDVVVDEFLQNVNVSLLRRDGFPMSPINEEKALIVLMSNPGNLERSRRLALMNISQENQYPGAGPRWTSDEQCRLARALSEHNRDFEYISRHILPQRTTKELVVHYYTRYKQQYMQFGERKLGLMFDRGIEAPPGMSMSPELMVDYLRYLAVTAGDGFPPERRMRDAVLSARSRLVRAVTALRAAEAPIGQKHWQQHSWRALVQAQVSWVFQKIVNLSNSHGHKCVIAWKVSDQKGSRVTVATSSSGVRGVTAALQGALQILHQAARKRHETRLRIEHTRIRSKEYLITHVQEAKGPLL